jgi:HlyD family secretion protein
LYFDVWDSFMSFVIRRVVPVAAILLLAFSVYYVVKTGSDAPPPGSVSAGSHADDAPRSPFVVSVAAAGLIEGSTDNVLIGTNSAGIVQEIVVHVGDRVKPGDTLFRLRDTSQRAMLNVAQAALNSARAQHEKLSHMPRPEELPAREASVDEAQAVLDQAVRQLARMKKLAAENAETLQEVEAAQQTRDVAAARLKSAAADFALLKAGTWKHDLAVAAASVEQAQANVEQIETQIGLLEIHSPIAAEVLQVNIHAGEFAGSPSTDPLVVLGNTQQLHVRVDIDEQDIPRFNRHAKAVATIRGRREPVYKLEFVRVEPYVVPKQSLTGQAGERTDIRVLRVIYTIEPAQQSATPTVSVPQLFVGQQLEVFIDATASSGPAPASVTVLLPAPETPAVGAAQ